MDQAMPDQIRLKCKVSLSELVEWLETVQLPHGLQLPLTYLRDRDSFSGQLHLTRSSNPQPVGSSVTLFCKKLVTGTVSEISNEITTRKTPKWIGLFIGCPFTECSI